MRAALSRSRFLLTLLVSSDPGMSTANMQLVTIEVELREGEEEPVAKLEEGE